MSCLAEITVKAILKGFEDLPAKRGVELLRKLGKTVSESDLDAWSGTSKSLVQAQLGAALREPLLKEQLEVITLSLRDLDALCLARLLKQLNLSCADIDHSDKEVLMSRLHDFMSITENDPETAVKTVADETNTTADDAPEIVAAHTSTSVDAASLLLLQSTVEEGETSEQEGETSEQVIFCPQGHNTVQTTCSTFRWGICDVCNAKVYKGDFLHKCQPCNWWCCIVCASKGANSPLPKPLLVRQLTASGWPLQPPKEEIEEFRRLSSCQINALAHIRRICKQMHEEALPPLIQKVTGIGYTKEDLQRCLDYIREEAPLIVHVNLQECAGKLANDTHYRNQFETHTSGGYLDDASRTRRLWEEELFGDCYADASPFERPKYGVLNITQDPHGIRECAQYGKSYLQLQGVRLRTTLSAMDSGDLVKWHGRHHNPQLPHVWALPEYRLATVDYYAHVLLEYSTKELRAVLDVSARKEGPIHSKILRKYKEIQIHGEMSLARNVSLIAVHTGQSPSKATLAKLSDTCNGAPVIPLHSTMSTCLQMTPFSKDGDEVEASSFCSDHSKTTAADTDASTMTAAAKRKEIDPFPQPMSTHGNSIDSPMSAEEAKLAERIDAISRSRSEELRAQNGHLVS